MKTLRLGTRGSALARTQSEQVREALESQGDLRVELEIIRTSGDLHRDRPLPEIGGKGLFTRELDRALLDGAIDLAVHSLKDLPTETPDGLVLAAVPLREDPRDVLIGREGQGSALAALAPGSVVGTSSLRRQALTLAFRSDLEVRPIRGNLDTRIRKVEEGEFDAIVVAAAGVLRLGMKERVGEWLERTAWLPAPGQGALALVAREDDAAVRAALETLDDAASRAAVVAERSFLRALGGGCQMPIAALGLPFDGGLRLWGLVASPDGARLVRADRTGTIDDPAGLGGEVAEILRERGAREILARLEREDVPGLTHP